MASQYSSFPGMDDILPGEIEKWQWLEEKTRTAFACWGFNEIRTPLLEPTELFTRSIGETTDIVHKEMYTFKDRGDRNMTLRPEMTASVARAVIQNGLLKTNKFLKLFYTGAMFRAERPQAGRKRQFHQIGAELVNLTREDDPYYADWLIVRVLINFLDYLKIKNLKFRINDLTLINGEQAELVRSKLRKYFESHKSKLDPDSVYRLDKNVLRIFDSKIETTRALIRDVPWNDIAPFSEEFLKLNKLLQEGFEGNVSFEIDRTLVRGLDYYTGVVFEVASSTLGAQDALAGGGRYDRLYEELGSTSTPCTGFSIGMERLLMVLEKNNPTAQSQMSTKSIYFASIFPNDNHAAFLKTVGASRSLTESGFRVIVAEPSPKLGDHLKRASKLGASYTVIRGDQELTEKKWTVKNMMTGDQASIPEGGLLNYLMQNTKELELP